jgi:hypothetical protein
MFFGHKATTEELMQPGLHVMLKQKIELLEKRVTELERATDPFLIGKPSPFFCFDRPDPRTKVSVREALRQILCHLNLEFTETEAVSSCIKLKKAVLK